MHTCEYNRGNFCIAMGVLSCVLIVLYFLYKLYLVSCKSAETATEPIVAFSGHTTGVKHFSVKRSLKATLSHHQCLYLQRQCYGVITTVH